MAETCKAIISAMMFLFIGCSDHREVEYTKGFPFWKYLWNDGELVATYYNSDGWKYLKYVGIDTLISPTGEKFSGRELTCVALHGESKEGIQYTFYDCSKLYVNGKVIEFKAMRRDMYE